MNDESSEGGVLVTEIEPSEGSLEPSLPGGSSEQDGPQEAEESAPEGAPQAPSKLGPGEDLTDKELDRRLAALVYASPEPLSSRRLADLLERPAPKRVTASLKRLGECLSATGLPLELKKIAGGWRILTESDLDPVLGELIASRRIERMSPASLETLAIVAYRQPATKAEIEAIRGVGAGPMLRSLVDRGLVRVVGRAKQPGNPLQYGTTAEFLDRFGLGALKDLPRDDELARD
jgi:segregation and condensation protein B